MGAQSVLVDYFALVNRYNVYARCHVACSIFMWVAYSVSIWGWTFSLASLSELAGWYLIQGVATVLIIFVVGMFSLVKVCSLKLHAEMATAMALDLNKATKLRWMAILEYYFPKPAYCLTISESTEISWLFCFQVGFSVVLESPSPRNSPLI